MVILYNCRKHPVGSAGASRNGFEDVMRKEGARKIITIFLLEKGNIHALLGDG